MFSRLVFFRRDPRCREDYRSCFENTRWPNRVCNGFAANHPTSAHVRLSITFILRFHSPAACIIATAMLQCRSIRATVDLPSVETNNLPQIPSGFRGSPSFSISPRIAIDGLSRILLFRFTFSLAFSLPVYLNLNFSLCLPRANTTRLNLVADARGSPIGDIGCLQFIALFHSAIFEIWKNKRSETTPRRFFSSSFMSPSACPR